jgi:hypothetical protein
MVGITNFPRKYDANVGVAARDYPGTESGRRNDAAANAAYCCALNLISPRVASEVGSISSR